MIAAAAPSANSAVATTLSIRADDRKCSVHNSTQTSSTRPPPRASASAVRMAARPPKQPWKFRPKRCVEGESPSACAMRNSMPGMIVPVDEAAMTCVICERSPPQSRMAACAASRPRTGASSTKIALRSSSVGSSAAKYEMNIRKGPNEIAHKRFPHNSTQKITAIRLKKT